MGIFWRGIDGGETPEEALKREIKEELDFDLGEFSFIGKLKTNLEDGGWIERDLFLSKISIEDFHKFKLQEGDSMKFFNLSDVRNLKLSPGDDKVLDLVEKNF